MVKSMFAAIAGLKTHQSRMDVISNNIANVNTWGYKSRSANFADAMYQNMINGQKGEQIAGYNGGMNTSQLGFGVNLGSISTNFTTGSWNPTGDGLHCMINGPSFFMVRSYPNGDKIDPTALKENGISLSRVGIFAFDNSGYLVDDQGNYVFGYEANIEFAQAMKDKPDLKTGPDGYLINPDGSQYGTDKIYPVKKDSLAPIRIPSATFGTDEEWKDGKRLDIQSTTIGQDGTIVGIDKEGVPHTIGQILVASVGNPNGLEQDQGYLYGIGPNAGEVAAVIPGSESVGKILSGYLEMSNVDLASEIATMITTQRGYQANSKIITVTDEMLEQLVNMKR